MNVCNSRMVTKLIDKRERDRIDGKGREIKIRGINKSLKNF